MPLVNNERREGLFPQLSENSRFVSPVAANVGVFWPKRGIYRTPGTAVIEFLPRIPAGLAIPEITAKLEQVIETRSNELMREAGLTEFEE